MPEVTKVATFRTTPTVPPPACSTNADPLFSVRLPALVKFKGLLNEGLMLPLTTVEAVIVPAPESVPPAPTAVVPPLSVPLLRVKTPPLTVVNPLPPSVPPLSVRVPPVMLSSPRTSPSR